MILASMNQTEDPCTDFYEYACGNWKNTHKIPDEKTKFGNFRILTDKVEMDVKDILLNATLEEKEPQNATNKAILAYRVCLCETVNETEKFNDLLKLLKEGGFTEWPLLNKENSPYRDYTQLLNKSTFLPFVKFTVFQDAKNIGSNVIYLDQISFDSVGRNELINQTTKASMKIVAAYKKLIQSTAKVFRPNLTDEMAQQLSEDILRFEATLAKLSRAKEDRRNSSSMHNEMNISTLSQTYPKIEWLKLFNHVFALANMTLIENERVIVFEPSYIQGIQEILEKANIDKSSNYGWVLTPKGHFRFLASLVRNSEISCRSRRGSGTPGPNAKRKMKRCVRSQATNFGPFLSESSAETTWPRAHLLGDASGITTLLKKRIASMQRAGKQYRAKQTKERDQLKNPNDQWFLLRYYLINFYVPPIFLNYSFLNVLHGLNLNSDIQELLSLRKPYKKEDEWYTGAAVVNAFYSPTTNDITFPAGILQPPFFQDDVPSSINMGAIGMIIGHEITHGFDDRGDQFDADGQLRNWWTKQAQKEFFRRAQCFIEQYSNVTVKEVNLTVS
ncbi:unnamed protein product, partial [Ixodes persulcatus]